MRPPGPLRPNPNRVLQSYQAWKEAAGLLSLIHLQRQEVTPRQGSMDSNDGQKGYSREGVWSIGAAGTGST